MKLEPIYSVVLRSNIPPREREFFEAFSCGTITPNTEGESLLHFQCTKIDVSHHMYIEMETFRQGDVDTSPLKIPHQFVLAIHGFDAKHRVGF